MYNPSFDTAITRPRTDAGLTNRAARGLFATARVATPRGWRAIKDLNVGDPVRTLDYDTQPIVRIEQVQLSEQTHLDAPKTWPLFVPRDAIGNGRELMLAADQPVLIDGGPSTRCGRAILQASELFGHSGIFRVIPDGPLNLTCLYFDTPATLFGHEGVLYHCNAAPEAPRNLRNRSDAVYYRHLTTNDATGFLAAYSAQSDVPSFGSARPDMRHDDMDQMSNEWMVIG